MNNVIFTANAGSALKEHLQGVVSSDVFILVDTNTREHCLGGSVSSLCPPEHIITIREGEQHKSVESVVHIWSVLTARGARRNSVLVNIGGGLITDIGGFAASCFKRGIRCINVPTTLLSQVDASVGGKTGINFGGFKNEIGTFSVPECVIIDNGFLKTLSARQVLSGFAEMLKHALLSGDEQLDKVLQANLSRTYGQDFLELLRESVAVKDAIVIADPKEKGVRKALNLGHTAGHALESVAIDHAIEMYHGDAVAYGLIVELYLSVKRLGFPKQQYETVRGFIREYYPHYVPAVPAETLYGLMLHDKKNDREGVNFTLLRKPGDFVIDNYCSKDEIIEALQELI